MLNSIIEILVAVPAWTMVFTLSCLASFAITHTDRVLWYLRKTFYVYRNTTYNELCITNLVIRGISYWGLGGPDGRVSSIGALKFAFQLPTFHNAYFGVLEITDIRHFGPLAFWLLS
ncbi:hypothetical protein M422DRAFT_251394 [Sphaerobolus stellatus SS14]|uniref:Unplaced genomic scaffold SPHSTscaffold_38, whole genome shotgun sequence n=1 Tax=Sphaerobolus stellatus (strain SS14) TaxID=990650 RepID=A0A0C9UQJ1_SPHS4|nr:hypothetical protein M422DRAFT_251394 [Sphaerobolus stellatus SS14]